MFNKSGKIEEFILFMKYMEEDLNDTKAFDTFITKVVYEMAQPRNNI
jgi:hypothetical protein